MVSVLLVFLFNQNKLSAKKTHPAGNGSRFAATQTRQLKPQNGMAMPLATWPLPAAINEAWPLPARLQQDSGQRASQQISKPTPRQLETSWIAQFPLCCNVEKTKSCRPTDWCRCWPSRASMGRRLSTTAAPAPSMPPWRCDPTRRGVGMGGGAPDGGVSSRGRGAVGVGYVCFVRLLAFAHAEMKRFFLEQLFVPASLWPGCLVLQGMGIIRSVHACRKLHRGPCSPNLCFACGARSWRRCSRVTLEYKC